MNFNYVAIRDGKIIAYFQNYDDAMDFYRAKHSLADVEIKSMTVTYKEL